MCSSDYVTIFHKHSTVCHDTEIHPSLVSPPSFCLPVCAISNPTTPADNNLIPVLLAVCIFSFLIKFWFPREPSLETGWSGWLVRTCTREYIFYLGKLLRIFPSTMSTRSINDSNESDSKLCFLFASSLLFGLSSFFMTEIRKADTRSTEYTQQLLSCVVVIVSEYIGARTFSALISVGKKWQAKCWRAGGNRGWMDGWLFRAVGCLAGNGDDGDFSVTPSPPREPPPRAKHWGRLRSMWAKSVT